MASTQFETIRQSDLLGRLVLDRNAAEELGRVEQLWIHLPTHQVLGLTCKSGLLSGQRQTLTWHQISAIGADSILVDLHAGGPDYLLPEEQDRGLGREIWTDTGNRVGKLIDYVFNGETGKVIGYIFIASAWVGLLDGTYLFAPEAMASVGSKRLIAVDSLLRESQRYHEGIYQKVTQAGEFLQKDLEDTKRHLDIVQTGLQSAWGKGKAIADQLKDKAQIWAEQAKDQYIQLKTELDRPIDEPPSVSTIDVDATPMSEKPLLASAQEDSGTPLPPHCSESKPTE